MQATIPHSEAVFGHGLEIFSKRFDVRQKLSLEVVSSADNGANFHHFDGETGIFQMSEDIFRENPVVPLYALARLAAWVSHKENTHPGSGRGAVSYSWRDGGEFMIRAESAMTTDTDGKYHFTDTEYRKIRCEDDSRNADWNGQEHPRATPRQSQRMSVFVP